MTKNQKNHVIKYLSKEFEDSNTLVVCDYRGVTVKNLEHLRSGVRNIDAKVQVVKNTLAKIALKNSNYPDLDLKDTNIFIWGKNQVALSKVVVKFAESSQDKFVIKAGSFDREKVDSKHVISISKLPSKDELIGMLLSVWAAPARYFVTGLDNLRKEKEK